MGDRLTATATDLGNRLNGKLVLYLGDLANPKIGLNYSQTRCSSGTLYETLELHETAKICKKLKYNLDQNKKITLLKNRRSTYY